MRRWVPFWLALWAAFAGRVFRLGAQSIWWDEGISLHLATSSWAEIAANRVVNIHPPLYFWGLKGWVSLLGVGAFSGRYLSVLASLLQVVLIYALARRWFGARRTAWAALLLTAVAPLSLIYGQELRVYAILPLIYLSLLLLTRQVIRQENAKTAVFLSLALVTWVGLHLHYITIFALFYVNVWAFFALGRRRAWRRLRRWVAAQGAAAIASLPWAAAVLLNWPAVQAEANAGTYLTEAAPLDFLLSQVWVFHLTALPGALGRSLVQWLAGGTAVLLLLLLGLRLWQWQTRRWTATLLAHWFLPLSLAVVVWSVRSFSHPRYISPYALTLLPLLAFLLLPPRTGAGWGKKAGQGVSLLLGGCALALALWANYVYFFDATLAKNDDMRGLAAYLEGKATADDLIIIPDTDWSLVFEYEGPAKVVMPGTSDPAQMWSDLAAWTAERRRVFTVSYRGQPGRDWQDVIPFALERAGDLEGVREFAGLRLRTYALRAPVAAPGFEGVNGRFGPLHLNGVSIEPVAAANNGVTVALRWQLAAPVPERRAAKLTLLDVSGLPLATQTQTLVDPRGRPVPAWEPGQTVTSYAFLPIPPGTPPLTYEVIVEAGSVGDDGGIRMVDLLDERGQPAGQRLLVGETAVADVAPDAPRWYGTEVDVPPLPQPASLAPGLQLLGAEVDRQEVGPGQPLFVRTHWQKSGPVAEPIGAPRLLLVQAGRILAESEAAPAWTQYPATQWGVAEQVVVRRMVTPPPGATGVVDVVLALGEEQVMVATVQVAETAHLFAPPPIAQPLDVSFDGVARLIGYELAETAVASDDVVSLTLYWESLTTGTERGYTVFTHILDEDGRLIGQHDAPPANGWRPTTGWVRGEIIIDEHSLPFRQPYRGEAVIEVGLYDTESGARLQTDAEEDFFYLPVTLQVRE